MAATVPARPAPAPASSSASRARTLRPGVSAVLLTRDAEARLEACLAALDWCSEVIVLDSGSRDRTLDIARAHDADVLIDSHWPGVGPQRNRAIAQARCEWVLVIDVDEEVTPPLRDEIERLVADWQPMAADGRTPQPVAWTLARQADFCGLQPRHGGVMPDRVARLFRNGAARYSDDPIDERLLADGPLGALAEPLRHHRYERFEQALAKLDRQTSARAQAAYARGERVTPAGAAWRAIGAFLHCYLLQGAVLDGAAGYLLASYRAQQAYYRAMKLWAIERDAEAGSRRASGRASGGDA